MDTQPSPPSLMSATASGAEPAQQILARLAHGTPGGQPGRSRTARWFILLVLALFALAVAGWLLHTPHPPQQRPAVAVAGPVAPAHDAAAPAAASATIATIASITHAGQAAAIVNETATPEPQAHHTLSPAPPARHNHGAPIRSTPVPTLVPAPASAPALARMRPPANAASSGNTANTGSSASATSRPPVLAPDTDVTLLTALVAHAYQPTAVVGERSRDVVLRRDGDSSATLLARCKLLGEIEGLLCRSRICAGRWESDAACRLPAH